MESGGEILQTRTWGNAEGGGQTGGERGGVSAEKVTLKYDVPLRFFTLLCINATDNVNLTERNLITKFWVSLYLSVMNSSSKNKTYMHVKRP